MPKGLPVDREVTLPLGICETEFDIEVVALSYHSRRTLFRATHQHRSSWLFCPTNSYDFAVQVDRKLNEPQRGMLTWISGIAFASCARIRIKYP